MNRAILMILIVVVFLIVGGIAAVTLLFGSEPVSPANTDPTGAIGINDPNYVPYPSGVQGFGANTSPEAAAVQSAFAAWLALDNPDNIRLGNTAVERGYALQLWSGDVTGGQALLKYSTASEQWEVLEMGGGAWTAEGLVAAAGVPADVAKTLVIRASRR